MMVVVDRFSQGTPCWGDVMTTDVEGAKAFYSSLFGWTFTDGETPDEGNVYIMAMKGDKFVAGLGPAHEGMPTVWSTYFAVESVDEAVLRATAAGGTVVSEAMDVYTAGRMAFVADPQGGVFGLWQANDLLGFQLVSEMGAVCWNELLCDDPDADFAFYDSVLGTNTEKAPMEGSDYYLMRVGDKESSGGMAKPMPEMPTAWVTYFGVDDCDAVVAKAIEMGGTVCSGPIDIPGVGRLATLSDPQGAIFAVGKFIPPAE